MKELTDAARAALKQEAEDQADALWDSARDYGTQVWKDSVPTLKDFEPESALEWFGDLVDEDRLRELEEGSPPTAEELRAYQEAWVEAAERDGDADAFPGYAICEVRSGRYRGFALVMRSGYSFSEVTTWVQGVFATPDEAAQYLIDTGWP